MDAKEDIKFGDIIPIYGKPFGKGSIIRCMAIAYGVVIGFTKIKRNPRATPIYYKMDQKFDGYKDAYHWMIKSSYIMFGVISINKEEWLKEANRQNNYNNIMRMAIKGLTALEVQKKKNEKPKAHNDYFSF